MRGPSRPTKNISEAEFHRVAAREFREVLEHFRKPSGVLMVHDKIVYGPPGDEEWVKVRAFMNSKFPAESPCSMCQGISCGMVWYSLKNSEVRCVKCFTPADPWE